MYEETGASEPECQAPCRFPCAVGSSVDTELRTLLARMLELCQAKMASSGVLGAVLDVDKGLAGVCQTGCPVVVRRRPP